MKYIFVININFSIIRLDKTTNIGYIKGYIRDTIKKMNNIQDNKKIKVYTRLYQDLKDDILKGNIDFDTPILGELDLAEKYEISRKSVRKALQLLDDEGFLKKVPGHGTFVRPPEEREANKRSNLKMGVILPWNPIAEGIRGEYDELLLEGISAHAYRQNFQITILEQDADFKSLNQKFSRKEIDGIIWDRPSSFKHKKIIARLLEARIPLLTINRTISGAACLLHDYQTELGDSVEFLKSMGHRKISFLNFDQKETIFIERGRAFFSACGKNGISDPEKHYIESSFEGFERSIEALLKKSSPSALIVGGCGFMLPFLQWAKNKNIKMPEDLSLLVLDDSYLAKSNETPVTVFAEPRYETGKQAVHCLELLIKGQAEPGEQFKIRGNLIARKTCASPK